MTRWASLLLGLVLSWSGAAWAGYFVTVTDASNPALVGVSGGCYLVPSIAVANSFSTIPPAYSQVTALSASGTFSVRRTNDASVWISGTFAECAGYGQGGALPTVFEAGAVDAAIQSGSVLNATGYEVSMFDYGAASAIFALFFSSVVGLWLLSSNIGLLLRAMRDW